MNLNQKTPPSDYDEEAPTSTIAPLKERRESEVSVAYDLEKGQTSLVHLDLSLSLLNVSVWRRIPNTSFGICMGLAGQAVLWSSSQNAAFLEGRDTAKIGAYFWLVSLVLGIILMTAYACKALFYFPLVKDEFRDGSRVHFFNMPHLVLLLLGISLPETYLTKWISIDGLINGQRVIFAVGFFAQLTFTQIVYERWLFHKKHNISCAQPQFLLSTVGWFFLAVLGAITNIEAAWGLAIPTFCFGVGIILYLMVAISVFNSVHAAPQARGNPALFLLIAPPSVGSVAWDLMYNNPGVFAPMSQMLLGWCLMIVLLLFKLGPMIRKRPPVLGSYWAYVFPLSALATACIRYAWAVNTEATKYLAIFAMSLAVLSLFVVFYRMLFHMYQVLRGNASWGDPLLSPERLVSAKVVNYTELFYDRETA